MDYKSAGVDIDLADKFVERIKRMVGTTHDDRVVSGVGGFAALYRQDSDRLLAASTDGVGTKLKLAIELGRHDTVGIDLVAMCVNDLLCCGARPMFFLDYFATGKLELGVGEAVLKGIVDGCKQGRLALIGGETAEMPGMYAEGDYDLAGFSVGEVRPGELLDGSQVKVGDTLIGIASTGFHSNGYSLVRKILDTFPAEERKRLAGEVLMPTRIYVDLILGLREAVGAELTGMANITGSGMLNVPRMNAALGYRLDFMPGEGEIPASMSTVMKKSGLTDHELARTFNCGVGFVLAVRSPEKTLAWLRGRGEKAWVLGQVASGPEESISLRGEKL